MTANDLATSALDAARHGFPVFPLRPREKRPLQKGWQSSATTDLDTVEQLWMQHPDANIGIKCGGGLVVVEADSRAGEAALQERGLPVTTSVRTARGVHYYLRGAADTRVGVLPAVDVRGERGLVVAAGSIHPTGAIYTWITHPREVPPADIPEGIAEMLRGAQEGEAACVGSSGMGAVPPQALTASEIHEGRRNSTMFRIACSLRGRVGMTAEGLLAAVLVENRERCKPPLEAAEIEVIVSSAIRYDIAPRWATDPQGFAADPHLASTERHLLMVLAGYARDDGTCFPGLRRLYAESGINRNALQRAIQGLEAAGRISVIRGGRNRPNRYRLRPWTLPTPWGRPSEEEVADACGP